MTILQNVFIKTVVVPIVLACGAALLESAAALVKGRSKGPFKFRLWIRQQYDDGSIVIVPLLGQSLKAICVRDDIVDIDPMVNFDVAEFASLGIDLVVAAFSVDVVSLIQSQGDTTMIGYVLIAHVFALIGIVLFTMLNQLASPEEQGVKRIRAMIAIGLGMVAMMISFLAL